EAEPAVATIFSLLLSIRLVDDLLDGDPGSQAEELGAGPTANLALAFQAVAGQIIEAAGLSAERRAACHAVIDRAGLDTARGQQRDLGPAASEADYWQIVEAKTPPLICAALALGGLFAGAPEPTVRKLFGIGVPLGKIIQISDDLCDVMSTEAQPDWQRPQHNLALLYASTANHREKDRFIHLSRRAAQPEALAEAQKILVRCGAVSYCAYQLIELDRAARTQLVAATLPDSGPLEALLDRHLEPLEQLMRAVGVPSLTALG
ncbi:MAG: polyprenyl synthetase family protein, partial [Acidobacteriota bacterium]